MRSRKMQNVFFVSLITMASGCANPPVTEETKAIINDPLSQACEASYQCKVVPLQADCGVAQRYKVYSIMHLSSERQAELASGLVNRDHPSCTPTLPTALCINSVCQIVSY